MPPVIQRYGTAEFTNFISATIVEKGNSCFSTLANLVEGFMSRWVIKERRVNSRRLDNQAIVRQIESQEAEVCPPPPVPSQSKPGKL